MGCVGLGGSGVGVGVILLLGCRPSDKVIVHFGQFKLHREKGCGIVAKSQFWIRCITFCMK